MFDKSVTDAIDRYIELLKEYNDTTNIYSKKSYDHLSGHIEDSLNVASLVGDRGVHVDMGSGSGLPGIIMAIASPVHVICIESKERKRVFLNYIKEALDLDNVTVFDGDVQRFTHGYSGPKITSFSAKAFAKPPKLLMYLSMFRPHQYRKGAICWVPISERQATILKSFDDVVQLSRNGLDYRYFKIQMGAFQSYKADLKTQYNL
jgi:16S rRNA (guanine(527)-N(7))-methyltransferase RsmG